MVNTCLWKPSKDSIQQSNLYAFIQYVKDSNIEVADYQALYRWSIESPEHFWSAVWNFCGIKASRTWETVLDTTDNLWETRWFSQARLNFAENLLRYCEVNANKPAIIFWNEKKQKQVVSYNKLYTQVCQLSHALRRIGVEPGDCIAGYMPNVPDTVIVMLASASLGAIWTSCSPDFGLNGVVDRFGQIQPKVLFCTDGYYYKGKTINVLPRVQALQPQLPNLVATIVCPYLREVPNIDHLSNGYLLEDFITEDAFDIRQQNGMQFEQLPFDHPLYIMYSSGTTGAPKCIVHGAGGTLLQHLKELVLHTDVKPIDRIFYFSTCGWMMWNWLVSSLSTGATIMLYDGDPFYPSPRILFDYIEEEKISIFGVSAKYLSAVEKVGLCPGNEYKLAHLRTILTTGSPLVPESFDFVYQKIKANVQLSSISGGTDIISCFALGNPLLPVYRGELQCIGLGMKVEVYNEQGSRVKQQKGELVCTAAFPSMPLYFWNDLENKKYISSYFEAFNPVWAQGDFAEITEHDGLVIYGRSDTVLNPGGVRIGTAEIYRQVDTLPLVEESIAVGQQWNNDVRIVLFVKLVNGSELTDELKGLIRSTIRQNVSPRHVPNKIISIKDIPRTISGKLVELSVANIVNNRAVKNIHALANPEALEYFKDLNELRSD